MKKIVIGHKNPDTDSIVSAIIFSDYLKKMKIEAVPASAGKINRETQFVLSQAKRKKIKLISKAPAKTSFYLVDHNDLDQSISGINEENVVGVVDHHKMSGLKTMEPIFYRNETVGSTSTLIAKMFKEKGWSLNIEQKFLLTAGIVSDTLNLTSKTATIDDVQILNELTRDLKINRNKLAKEMFEKKSDISGMKLKDVLLADFKDYKEKNKKVSIGVVETVSVNPILEKKQETFSLLKEIKKEKKSDYLFFFVVDIINNQSIFYSISKEESSVANKAFNCSIKECETVLLKEITSRKKQIAPVLLKLI